MIKNNTLEYWKIATDVNMYLKETICLWVKSGIFKSLLNDEIVFQRNNKKEKAYFRNNEKKIYFYCNDKKDRDKVGQSDVTYRQIIQTLKYLEVIEFIKEDGDDEIYLINDDFKKVARLSSDKAKIKNIDEIICKKLIKNLEKHIFPLVFKKDCTDDELDEEQPNINSDKSQYNFLYSILLIYDREFLNSEIAEKLLKIKIDDKDTYNNFVEKLNEYHYELKNQIKKLIKKTLGKYDDWYFTAKLTEIEAKLDNPVESKSDFQLDIEDYSERKGVLNPKRCTVAEYLGWKKEITIPIFQRNYIWPSINASNLVASMIEKHMKNKSDNQKDCYYLNNISLSVDNNGFKILDGQQRTTTLFLIVIAFYRYLYHLMNSAEGMKDKGLSILNHLNNKIPLKLILEKGQSFSENNDDYNHFLTIYKENNRSFNDRDKKILFLKSQFHSNYETICKELQERISTINDLESFIDYFLNDSDIIIAPCSVSNESDATDIYIRMNQCAQPLSAIDLLKSRIDQINQENKISSQERTNQLIVYNKIFNRYFTKKSSKNEIDIDLLNKFIETFLVYDEEKNIRAKISTGSTYQGLNILIEQFSRKDKNRIMHQLYEKTIIFDFLLNGNFKLFKKLNDQVEKTKTMGQIFADYRGLFDQYENKEVAKIQLICHQIVDITNWGKKHVYLVIINRLMELLDIWNGEFSHLELFSRYLLILEQFQNKWNYLYFEGQSLTQKLLKLANEMPNEGNPKQNYLKLKEYLPEFKTKLNSILECKDDDETKSKFKEELNRLYGAMNNDENPNRTSNLNKKMILSRVCVYLHNNNKFCYTKLTSERNNEFLDYKDYDLEHILPIKKDTKQDFLGHIDDKDYYKYVNQIGNCGLLEPTTNKSVRNNLHQKIVKAVEDVSINNFSIKGKEGSLEKTYPCIKTSEYKNEHYQFIQNDWEEWKQNIEKRTEQILDIFTEIMFSDIDDDNN